MLNNIFKASKKNLPVLFVQHFSTFGLKAQSEDKVYLINVSVAKKEWMVFSLVRQSGAKSYPVSKTCIKLSTYT